MKKIANVHSAGRSGPFNYVETTILAAAAVDQNLSIGANFGMTFFQS